MFVLVAFVRGITGYLALSVLATSILLTFSFTAWNNYTIPVHIFANSAQDHAKKFLCLFAVVSFRLLMEQVIEVVTLNSIAIVITTRLAVVTTRLASIMAIMRIIVVTG